MPIQALQAERECKSRPALELTWQPERQTPTGSATGSLGKLPRTSPAFDFSFSTKWIITLPEGLLDFNS